MPPALLYDISQIDLNQVLVGKEGLREVNPQRGDMEQIDAICWFDHGGRVVGYKDVRAVLKWQGFIGFGGVEHCKFRKPVLPGCRLYLLAQQTDQRHHRFTSLIQGLVDGQLVFEATITGTVM
jgi:3-hydroxyacyl-[acyl-carrier-protein] dehydratase